MNLQSYIESGLLELYVLDNLSPAEKSGVERMLSIYPKLKVEILKIELAFERYANVQAVNPPAYLESAVINKILSLSDDEVFDNENLPLISQNSNLLSWLNFINTLKVEPVVNGRSINVLRQDKDVTQMLIISNTDIEKEIHHNEHESFFILKGECKCVIGDEVMYMKAGDFMQIPLNATHHVEILSIKVVAILQHIRV